MTSGNWGDPGSAFGVATAIFALTALPAGVLFGALQGDLQAGLGFGLFFGLAFAICMIPFMRSTRVTLHFSDRAEFERRLTTEMSALTYTPAVINPDLVHYNAPQNGVISIGPLRNMTAAHLNRIAVHFDTTSATLIGPQWMLRKVLRRVGSH